MAKNTFVTPGTLKNRAAVAKVKAKPIAARRKETARRSSLMIQAMTSKATMPNADCSCCIRIPWASVESSGIIMSK